MKNVFLPVYIVHSNQNHEEFESYCVNFVLLLGDINNEFPICSIVTGDSNAPSSN